MKYYLKTLALTPRLVGLPGEAERIHFSKQLAVVIYLVARPRAQATRDELLGLLWSGAPERDARASLRQVVYQIRQATDPGFVVGDELLRVRREDLEFDVELFRTRHAQGQHEAALEVYEQDFLATVGLGGARDFESWAEGVRQQLAAERRQLLRTLIGRASDAARWSEGARYARLLIEADPGALDPRLKLVELLALGGDAVHARDAAAEARDFAQATEGSRPRPELEAAIERALAPVASAPLRAAEALPRAPEMVGRAAEFRVLVEKLKSALQGRGRSALITGEAGIGKTRLTQELMGRARSERCLVLRSAFYAIEQSDPMGPFLDLLRAAPRAPGLGGASPGSLSILGALVPEISDRFRHAAESTLTPVTPQALAEALLDAFAAISEELTLVLVVEDLHWALPEAIEFAHRLARRAQSHHIVLLLTARDYGDAPGATEALRSLTASDTVAEVTLGPLGTADVGQLLDSIAEPPDQASGRWLAAQLVRRTLGVPLYVLEVLKSLVDSGLLSERGGRWAFGPGLRVGDDVLPIPETAAALLEFRLRTVGERAGAVLAAMAVWGRGAAPAVLSRLTGLGAPAVELAIRALERRRLITSQGDAVVVAHEELAGAALRATPQALLVQLYERAARLARDSARGGRGGDWMVAARFAALAGRPDRAALDAARAAGYVQRSSGRAASREMLARALDSMPAEVRGHLQVALQPVLRGKWTATRWLAERTGWPRRMRILGAAAAVAVLAAGAAAAPRLLASHGAAPALGGGEIAIGWGVPGHLDSIQGLRVDLQFRSHREGPASLPPGVRDGYYPRLVRSDRRAAVYPCALPGVDEVVVCRRDLVSGEVSTLVRFDGDARPIGWLPDGSALMVLRGYAARAGRPGYGVVLVDSTGRTIRTVVRDSAAFAGVYLSPSGDRILALRPREGRDEAALLTLEGSLMGIVDWCSRAAMADWSPRGRRLACALERSRELEIGDGWPGSWPSHIGLPAAIVSGPVWSADGRYVAVSLGERQPGVYVVDRDGLMEPRRVAAFPAAPRLIGWAAATAAAPLHKIRVGPDTLRLTVGGTGRLRALGLGPRGQALGEVPEVRWLSADSSLARVDEDGRVTGDRPGRTFIVASFGLEQIDDTCYVAVDSSPAQLVLAEAFEERGGLDTVLWRPFGSPTPRVLPREGRLGSAGFNSRGDYSLTSGIALRMRLAADRGLTIEYWAAVPITRPVWQTVRVALYPAPADSFHLGRGPTSPSWNGPAVSVEGPLPSQTGREIMGQLSDANPNFNLVPLPASLGDGRWHRYRLVVYPDGQTRWFADGLELMPPGRANLGAQALWTLVIEGRSVGALAMVDDLKVWEGVRLDPVQPEAATARRETEGRVRE